MGKIKRYKKKAGRFLKSDSGQRFFNFAYSIGAAIVILGALFKILHLWAPMSPTTTACMIWPVT